MTGAPQAMMTAATITLVVYERCASVGHKQRVPRSANTRRHYLHCTVRRTTVQYAAIDRSVARN